jgi:hypothetical protein
MNDRFDDVLREVAQDYNPPPGAPRDLMWARIEAIRRERTGRRQKLRILYSYSPWTRWGVGLAAALAIGIGIGRISYEGRPEIEPLAVQPKRGGSIEAPARATLAYRLAATQHLSRAETFLTSFRTNARAGESDAERWLGAGQLLSSTWLLLDSPAAADPLFRELLQELEVVLVQIVQLAYERGDTELDLVTEGIERRGLLSKLRTAIPAGSAAGVEGVL